MVLFEREVSVASGHTGGVQDLTPLEHLVPRGILTLRNRCLSWLPVFLGDGKFSLSARVFLCAEQRPPFGGNPVRHVNAKQKVQVLSCNGELTFCVPNNK